MFALVSPAKRLDLDSPWPAVPVTRPRFEDDARQLLRTVRRLPLHRIRSLLGVSEELARRTRDWFREMTFPFTPENARPAVFTFDGDVYRGLDAPSLDVSDLEWAQRHLGILSGFFGLLRPLDLIQPHRLEMGTRLPTRRGADLYRFWGDRVTDAVAESLEGEEEPVLVNLASKEYFGVIQVGRLPGRVVSIEFLNLRPEGGRPITGFMAKRARGLMARYLIQERVDRVEGIRDFALEGYRFDPSGSTEERWRFTRIHVPRRRAG